MDIDALEIHTDVHLKMPTIEIRFETCSKSFTLYLDM